MEDILLPSKIEILPGERENESILTMEPFFHGYGHTVGNALRRILLSSLTGAAVTAVKIKGAQHEFAAIPHVKEDVLEIILNLKQLRLKLYSDEPVKLTLSVKGEKNVTAKDFEANSDVDIVNKNLHIATLTEKGAEFEMEVTVAKGRGYVPTEERGKDNRGELGTIAVDALYSPIRSVGYRVDDVRVGQITNFDRLTLNIETDGSIDAEEAIRQSAKVLIDHFALLAAYGSGEKTATTSKSEEAPAGEEAAETEAEGEGSAEGGDDKPKKKKAAKKKK